MNDYWIEVLNRLTLMVPAFLFGMCIGTNIKLHKKEHEDEDCN